MLNHGGNWVTSGFLVSLINRELSETILLEFERKKYQSRQAVNLLICSEEGEGKEKGRKPGRLQRRLGRGRILEGGGALKRGTEEATPRASGKAFTGLRQ